MAGRSPARRPGSRRGPRSHPSRASRCPSRSGQTARPPGLDRLAAVGTTTGARAPCARIRPTATFWLTMWSSASKIRRRTPGLRSPATDRRDAPAGAVRLAPTLGAGGGRSTASHQGVEKLRLADRLGEVGGDPQPAGSFGLARLVARGQHHQRRHVPGRVVPDPGRQLEAVHVGHHPVDDRRRRTAGRPPSASAEDRQRAGPRRRWSAGRPSSRGPRRGCAGWSRCRRRPGPGGR